MGGTASGDLTPSGLRRSLAIARSPSGWRARSARTSTSLRPPGRDTHLKGTTRCAVHAPTVTMQQRQRIARDQGAVPGDVVRSLIRAESGRRVVAAARERACRPPCSRSQAISISTVGRGFAWRPLRFVMPCRPVHAGTGVPRRLPLSAAARAGHDLPSTEKSTVHCEPIWFGARRLAARLR